MKWASEVAMLTRAWYIYTAATSGLEDEQKHFYQMALDFAQNEMAPNMAEWDYKVFDFNL